MRSVVVADDRDDERLRSILKDLGVEGHLRAGPEVLDGADRVVASPGVRPEHPVLRAAEERGLPIISEVGLGLELIGPGVRVAAVTGTNGKTTVVDMIHRMLEVSSVPHVVAGNSWRDLTGCVAEARGAGLLVLEVSSFQLHYLESPGFEVAALLNVRPDHLNWHESFEEYVDDKLRIFDGQRAGDLALVSSRDPVGRSALEDVSRQKPSSSEKGTPPSGRVVCSFAALAWLTWPTCTSQGRTYYENALFAAAAAQRFGADAWGHQGGFARIRVQAASHAGRSRGRGRDLRG